MIYRQTIEVPSYLCDEFDRLHPWAAIRLCQEVTEYHGNATGIGFKTLVTQNRAWVLTRALYNIRRLPDAFETVELSTWSRGHNGLVAWRDYMMTDKDGKELLSGTSYWPMIDMTTRHVLRLNDVIKGYENHDILATEHREIQKVKIPNDVQPDGEMQRRVVFSMLDHTRHVNNSEYIRMLFDLLHEKEFDTQQPFVIELNYNMESRLDEDLTIRHWQVEQEHFIQIDNPRAVSVTARIARI